jgi:hypothetical protein
LDISLYVRAIDLGYEMAERPAQIVGRRLGEKRRMIPKDYRRPLLSLLALRAIRAFLATAAHCLSFAWPSAKGNCSAFSQGISRTIAACPPRLSAAENQFAAAAANVLRRFGFVMLVCWSAGLLVCWSAGLLVCWSAGRLAGAA